MPRLRIIVLDKTDNDTYRFALWADVPAVRQGFYANANAKSAWKDATTQDNTNIQNGSVVERVGEQRVPSGSSLPQIENFLQSRWQDYQDFINSSNPWVRYGTTWDGTQWVVLNNG